MSDASKPNVYEIPEWNLDALTAKVNKINKRAAKLGCPSLEIVNNGTVSRILPQHLEAIQTGVLLLKDAPHFNVHLISIAGEGPKLAGWKFVGTLDHYSLPGTVIVNAVPGESVPQEFFHNDATCHQCNKIRRRIETFVVQHENGEYKQVGRNCIKDFLGHDPSSILRLLSTIRRLMDDLADSDGEYYGGSGRQTWTFDRNRILEVTNTIIRSEGWMSRSAAEGSGKNATANSVLFFFMPTSSSQEADARKEWVATLDWNEELDTNEANAAIEWLESQTSANEYMHNLQTIVQAEEIPIKLFGYWCSLMATYQRAMERLNEQKRTHKVSEWVGVLKVRQEFTVEIISIKYIEGVYGTVRLHKMLDDGGRTLTWFANTAPGMEIGQKYQIKGTVKKHDEYNNWKQTVLNRVAVIEEVE